VIKKEKYKHEKKKAIEYIDKHTITTVTKSTMLLGALGPDTCIGFMLY